MATTRFTDHLLEGTHAARPAASAVPQGTLYSCSDHSLIYQSDGTSSWSTWATLGTSGALIDPMTTRGDIIIRNSSNVTARLARGSADTYLGSDGTDVTYSAVTDAKLSTSDITTNNASTSKHGFLKKLDNTATNYMDGTGNWSAPSGSGGALVLLEQHTASTSATLDFTTFISSTYDTYLFELLQLRPATDNVSLYVRVGTGAGPSYDSTSQYYYASFRNSSTGSAVSGATQASPAAFVALDGGGNADNGANSAYSGTMTLYSPQDTGFSKRWIWQVGYVDNAGASLHCVGSGGYVPTTALTAIRFLMASGNITSGTIRVYGMTK